MSVVLRCPSCGTTRTSPGECEACHEAQVRFYCSRHTPGLWLDSPTCSSCGAVFGRPTPAGPAVTRPKTPPSRVAAPRSVAPIPSAPALDRDRFSEGTVRGGSRASGSADGSDLERSAEPRPTAPWQLLLGSVIRAGYLARSSAELRPPRGSGCLRRLLVTVTLILLAVGLALFLMARTLLDGY